VKDQRGLYNLADAGGGSRPDFKESHRLRDRERSLTPRTPFSHPKSVRRNLLRGGGVLVRIAVVAAAICLSIVGLSAADDAKASIRKSVNIPAEGLGPALQTLARTFNFQVLYHTEVVGQLRTHGVVGTVSVDEALTQLLRGTGLSYRYLDEKTITIVSTSSISTASGNAQSTSASDPAGSLGDDTEKDGKKSKHEPATQSDPVGPEEIVVTAQKREEQLMDVPMSLTALSGEQLESSQSYRFQDYVGMVPGLAYVSDSFGPTGSLLVIRGITTSAIPTHNSVASYIDDTPYGIQADCCSFLSAPNLDAFDMQRVEVLKGPQGTLYGASALAGLLKFVTNAPDPSAFASRAEIGTSSVSNGGTGDDAHAMVNLPLSNDAALRLVGYENYYPGFIDDPSRGFTDINGSRVSGGRASLLYEPVTEFSLRFNALYQDRTFSDSTALDVYPTTLIPVFGYLKEERATGQPGYTKNELYNITVNWDAGFAKLLSTTSYMTFTQSFVFDAETEEALVSSILGAPYGAAFPDQRSVNVWTQEVRLSAPTDNPVQWQLGGFFDRERTSELELFDPVDLATHQVLYDFPTTLGTFPSEESYREFAGFATIDYHLTRTVDVAAGARLSSADQTFFEHFTGLFGAPIAEHSFSEGVTTYSGDARWHITPDNMLYARVATGWVPGGATGLAPNEGLPLTYSPSTTVNYEAGIKSRLLENRFAIELSVFDVEWRDIQVFGLNEANGFSFNENAGAARSDGVEWQFAYIPVDGLTLGLNGAYTDARLTQATPSNVGGKVGDRLPTSPLWQTSASARYERPLFGSLSGFGHVDWRFCGSHYGDFEPIGPRPLAPSYNIVDLGAGVRMRTWSVAFYVKNIGNEIPIYYLRNDNLAQGGFGNQLASIGTPRTIGLELTATF
jgi:iron complex outermembrane recepter protein